MSEMIERVKNAVLAVLPYGGYEDVELSRRISRAAIAAMRKPTEAMLSAGIDAIDDGQTQGVRFMASAAYDAMIDAAVEG